MKPAYRILILILLMSLLSASCFAGASAEVTLPSSLETIEEEAFSGASSLEIVTLPESLQTIGAKAFKNSALSMIQFLSDPDTAEDAFQNCDNLVMFLPDGSAIVYYWNNGNPSTSPLEPEIGIIGGDDPFGPVGPVNPIEPVPVEATEENIRSAAVLAPANVLNAFENLGFKLIIDSGVNYSEFFDAKNRKLTLKKNSDTVYHGLGHFVAFAAGNVDKSTSFSTIFNEEKNTFPGQNKALASQNTGEYFAECFREYIVNKRSFAVGCPKTFAAIEQAISMITDAQVAKLKKIYAAYWK